MSGLTGNSLLSCMARFLTNNPFKSLKNANALVYNSASDLGGGPERRIFRQSSRTLSGYVGPRRSLIVTRLRLITETLPHNYYKFMTSLHRESYPPSTMKR